MGKGSDKAEGRSDQRRSIDPILEERGDRMAALAQLAAALGYQPNRGVTIAGFTPMQQAAFQNVSNAAGAFGMARPANPMAGMPQTQMQGGIAGYSSAPHFDAMVGALPPGYREALQSLFLDPQTGQGPRWATEQLNPDNPFASMTFTNRNVENGFNSGQFSLFSPMAGAQAPDQQPPMPGAYPGLPF